MNSSDAKYEIVDGLTETNGCVLAEVGELPKPINDGASRLGALGNVEAIIDAHLKTAQAAGWQIAKPRCRMAFA